MSHDFVAQSGIPAFRRDATHFSIDSLFLYKFGFV